MSAPLLEKSDLPSETSVLEKTDTPSVPPPADDTEEVLESEVAEEEADEEDELSDSHLEEDEDDDEDVLEKTKSERKQLLHDLEKDGEAEVDREKFKIDQEDLKLLALNIRRKEEGSKEWKSSADDLLGDEEDEEEEEDIPKNSSDEESEEEPEEALEEAPEEGPEEAPTQPDIEQPRKKQKRDHDPYHISERALTDLQKRSELIGIGFQYEEQDGRRMTRQRRAELLAKQQQVMTDTLPPQEPSPSIQQPMLQPMLQPVSEPSQTSI